MHAVTVVTNVVVKPKPFFHFYDGIDELWKDGLSLIFPVYLLLYF